MLENLKEFLKISITNLVEKMETKNVKSAYVSSHLVCRVLAYSDSMKNRPCTILTELYVLLMLAHEFTDLLVKNTD